MAQENIKLSPEIEQLSEKLQADPKSRVFAQLADAYRKSGLLDEAIDTAKRGLENHPNYATAHLILGRCYLAKGMYALAREEFELTIKNDMQSLVGYKLLGETYEKQNMYPEALKYYQMVLDMEPSDAELAEKITNLKSLKQPEPQAEAAPAEPEPAALPVAEAAETTPAETPMAEPIIAPAEPVIEASAQEMPAMPEVLLAEEEKAAEKESPEIALPVVLNEDPVAEVETTHQPIPVTEEAKAEITEAPLVVAEVMTVPSEPEPEATEAEPQGPTSTLAEIYVQQGFLEKAIDIYKELVAAQPDNEEYKNRMDELLEKAYPEEAPAIAEPIEAPMEAAAEKTEEKPAPVVTEVELPAPAEELKPTPEAAPVDDPFAQLFGSPDKKEEPVTEPVISEISAPAPAQEIEPSTAAAPVAEEKTPEPSGDDSGMDFGALFNDAGTIPSQPEEAAPAAEPSQPVAEAKPAEKTSSSDDDDTVSSFQSWLSQIQK
ncbi:MAG: tetratricopeptide repeat protein [Candidatus Edwardsbacteria bacterium]|nr:tetratricopeptide repeat protein [Candidatus Edwardsbacteria bacterium]MBU1577570.1 tetratricopeptide repeat protein [Candidatus Edwardsbacteria bacterium]MBU2462600.1 tetratricopeptide repeat protein [Candidatus Edwardsbacteria bacterium]MBU2593665.1 tetratricopeptide repeat protein [Candidatus Edwardsbacteria bacterium]